MDKECMEAWRAYNRTTNPPMRKVDEDNSHPGIRVDIYEDGFCRYYIVRAK